MRKKIIKKWRKKIQFRPLYSFIGSWTKGLRSMKLMLIISMWKNLFYIKNMKKMWWLENKDKKKSTETKTHVRLEKLSSKKRNKIKLRIYGRIRWKFI